MKESLNIPTELCQWALQKRQIPLLKLYLYFQFNYSGKLRLGKGDIELVCNAIGYKSTKQSKKHLKSLIKRNWIGFNPKSGYHFIRGIDTIRSIEGFKRQSAIRMEYKHLFHLREFCFAVFLENLINRQKRRKKSQAVSTKRQSNFLKKVTSQPDNSSVLYKPIANEAISKILGISKSLSHSLKKKCIALHYIHVKPNLIVFKGNTKDLNNKLVRKYHPNLRFINSVYYLQYADLVRTSLEGKKLNHI